MRIVRLPDAKDFVYDAARKAEVAVWRGVATVHKYNEGDPEPYELVIGSPQLLMYGGASLLFECLIGNGTDTAAQSLTYLDNLNTFIGVGDSNTAAAATQTDLQAASNKVRRGMNNNFPAHTDGVVAGAASIQWQATFSSSDANFSWEEWGVFNASTGGRMINRKVESLGVKSAGTIWVLTVTGSLA